MVEIRVKIGMVSADEDGEDATFVLYFKNTYYNIS